VGRIRHPPPDCPCSLRALLPVFRRYTVSGNAAAVRGGEPFYLVAELDWDDMDALLVAFCSPEGQATVGDVAEFAPDRRVRSMIFEVEDV
jgi:uncharacterized protein (TIGR02118 family)